MPTVIGILEYFGGLGQLSLILPGFRRWWQRHERQYVEVGLSGFNALVPTEERAKAIAFVGPYYHSGRGVFAPDASELISIDQLSGKTVAVTLGETHDKWAKEQSGWNVRSYKSLPEMILEANAGRVDAIVADKIPVLVAIKEQGLPLMEIPLQGAAPTANVGIAIRLGNPELAAAMQQALNDMQADVTCEAISMKWIGQDIR